MTQRDEIQRTNYDVVLAVAIKDAEREVLDMAEALFVVCGKNRPCVCDTSFGRCESCMEIDDAVEGVNEAVRALRRVREQWAG